MYIYIYTIYKVIISKPGDGLTDPSFIMWGLVIGRRYIPCIVAVPNISYAIFDATTPCQPHKISSRNPTKLLNMAMYS